jgi:hypothetical protein
LRTRIRNHNLEFQIRAPVPDPKVVDLDQDREPLLPDLDQVPKLKILELDQY